MAFAKPLIPVHRPRFPRSNPRICPCRDVPSNNFRLQNERDPRFLPSPQTTSLRPQTKWTTKFTISPLVTLTSTDRQAEPMTKRRQRKISIFPLTTATPERYHYHQIPDRRVLVYGASASWNETDTCGSATKGRPQEAQGGRMWRWYMSFNQVSDFSLQQQRSPRFSCLLESMAGFCLSYR